MKNYENTIICDVDSVVANLQHSWLGRYNTDYQDSLTPEQLTGWGMHAFVKPACGQKIFDYLSDQTLYDDVPPIAGALAGIRALRALGYRVVFATACNLHMGGRKLRWLSDHGFLTLLHGNLSHDYVEINDKSLLAGSAFAIIDDYPKNLRDFRQPVLFRQPHNHLGNPGNLDTFHADDWTAVVAHFDRLRKLV